MITKESFALAYPDLNAEIRKEAYDEGFKAGAKKTAQDIECPEECQEKAKKEGALAELTRIKAVKEQLIIGHEALIETLMFDGKTTGPEAAMKVLQVEKVLAESRHKAFLEDGSKLKVPATTPPDTSADSSLLVEERTKKTWDSNPDIRDEFRTYEAYLHFVKAQEAGRVKILKTNKEG